MPLIYLHQKIKIFVLYHLTMWMHAECQFISNNGLKITSKYLTKMKTAE